MSNGISKWTDHKLHAMLRTPAQIRASGQQSRGKARGREALARGKRQAISETDDSPLRALLSLLGIRFGGQK